MFFITIFLVLFAFVAPYRGDLDYVNEYVDEVLSENLPRIVEKASLDTDELPDFYFNVQDTLSEAEEFEGTVLFHSGNLTGLNTLNRRFCRYSSRSSGNNKIVCNVFLPRVGVRYRGRYEAATELTTSYGVRVQQRDFYSEIVFRDVEAQIELTKLNDSEQPSITNLLLLGEGEVTKRFLYNDETKNRLFNRFYVPFHEISGPFYQHCDHLIQRILYDSYRDLIEKAFSTVEYPEHY
ncbi:uncharacterized protein TNCT_266821 [Trichonephila clavata]|uniref:Uncharacterized protein n=1 Tax=Trichonephila clavata TaxID=2740835 RepID=A0A8X6FHV7_TRICU|nr:uncharacterized protein TNCT_266821 [Trichonephila clavata]